MSGNLLGEIVTWDTAGAKPVSVTNVRQALVAAGLPEDEAGDLHPRSAWGRACKDLKDGRIIRKVENDGQSGVRFQLTSEAVQSGRLEYGYECQIILDCETGAVACPENQQIEQMARGLIAQAMQERNSRDVTAIVKRLFERHAELYPINPRKGVAYFVPDAHASFSAQVETFLRSMGGVLWRFPVPKGTAEGDLSVQGALKHGFDEKVAELQAVVAEWDEATRKGTMERAVEKFQTLEFKIECYRDLLKDEADKLNNLIATQKAAVLARLALPVETAGKVV